MTNYKVAVNTSDFHNSATVPILPDLREDFSSCQHKQSNDACSMTLLCRKTLVQSSVN